MLSGNHDRGSTLVEAMIAILVAFIAMGGIGAAVFRASVSNKNEGTEQARLTVLAQQKSEELLRLDIGNTTDNTTLITDTGWSKGLTAGGGTDMVSDCTAATVIGYVDFLEINGQPVADTCANAMAGTSASGRTAYQRRWQITDIQSVASAELLGYGDGSNKDFSATLAAAGITPGSVSVFATISGAPVAATDDSAGNISGIQIVPGLSHIDYTTGAINVKFTQPPDYNTPVNVTVASGTTVPLKQITVAVYSLVAVRTGQALPKVSLTSLKTQ